MLKVADFLAQLSEADRMTLLDDVGGGLHDARLAARCLTDPGRHAENTVQLLAYLTGAVERLEHARDLVRRRA
jgi:hypothetical protein